MLTALLLHTALAGATLAQAPAAVDASDTSGTSEPAVLDAELEPYRAELLELAHRMAIALPEFPHVKDRSRLQDDVAAACFALDQPRRALGYVDQIVNWRRGAGYADYAFYCAQRGAEAEAEQYLARAQEIAAWPEDEIKQAWRRDRIRAKIARTYTVLGRPAEAARFAAGLETSEWGQVEAVEAATVPDDEFDAWFRKVERAVDTENFDLVRNGLIAMAQAHARHYDDVERRDRLVASVKRSWNKLPPQLVYELGLALGENALAHADHAAARAFADEARKGLDATQLSPRTQLPVAVRLAELRFRAGDAERARAEADAALATYQEQRHLIADVFRCEAVIPLAEGNLTLGARETALAMYELAATEAIENPNSRPRAEDLGAVCLSMALRGVEPSEQLWEILREITPTLGHEYSGIAAD